MHSHLQYIFILYSNFFQSLPLPLPVEQHTRFQTCSHTQARSETVTLLFSLQTSTIESLSIKMAVLPYKILMAILPFFLHVNAQASGTGTTTRYWDCCKPSCSWPGKATLAAGSNPVGSCDANDGLLADYNTASGCDGGSAYMCSDESPWAVSDTLSYGYAAVNIAGGTEASWCCACYELTFTSGPVAGKQMIVQATNTGGDLGANHFDLAVCLTLTVTLSCINTDIALHRCPAVASESPTAAPKNSAPLPPAGAPNMAAFRLAPNVMLSLRR
jgi:hypothetical protein